MQLLLLEVGEMIAALALESMRRELSRPHQAAVVCGHAATPGMRGQVTQGLLGGMHD